MKLKTVLLFLFSSLFAYSQNSTLGNSKALNADSLFFAQKRELLTATWNVPFDYKSIKSNHAPLGPYMGNGDVGIVTFTSGNSQTFKISKVDFITDGWTGKGATWTSQKLRQPEALPVGGVSITVNSPASTLGFEYQMDQLGNELRMNTATVGQVKMTSWIAVDENVIVTELSTTSKTPVDITVDTYADSLTMDYTTTAGVKKQTAQVTRRTRTDDMRWISQAGISTRIVGATPFVIPLSEAKTRSCFKLTHSEIIRVVTYVSGGGVGDDAKLTSAYQSLQSLNKQKISKLKAAKTAWWKDMWTRSYVETNDELLNRHYLSSIYLLASAYNRHSPVCGGMYGVWNMDDKMMYRGDIHLNYNSQAGFYSVFSANRPELALPFCSTIEKMIPEGRKRAREELGIMHPSLKGKSYRGILFPVGALGIGGLYSSYWQQTMNAPFCVPLFSWYYEYTGDLDFLRNSAYPFIRECGDFYEDYMTKEKDGDTYRYTIRTGAHEGSWDLNPASELGFVEQIFSLLLRYSELLGVDADRMALWKDILTHLPKYKVVMPTKTPNQGMPVYAKNENGWDNPNHLIQLHPVYPCEVLNLNSNPDSVQIARNTIFYYGVSQNGFIKGGCELGLSAFIMGARVGFSPEILCQKMKELIKDAKPNFLITDGHHCSEKTTVIETINSMMLQSVDGILHLYPCWTKTPAAFTRIRTKGAFLVSSDYDGNTVSNLRIYSEKGNNCRLKNPWKGKHIEIQENGIPVLFTEADDVYSFSTRAGGVYEIRINEKL